MTGIYKARRVRRADPLRFCCNLSSEARQWFTLVALATHVTESWVPHLEVTPVGKTVQSLKDQIIDEALANAPEKAAKRTAKCLDR